MLIESLDRVLAQYALPVTRPPKSVCRNLLKVRYESCWLHLPDCFLDATRPIVYLPVSSE